MHREAVVLNQTGRRRDLIAPALDSVRQQQMVPADPTGWRSSSVSSEGRVAVRAALLLSDNLAVTHSQLFDGRAMLALGPAGFAQLAGVDPYSDLPLRVLFDQRFCPGESCDHGDRLAGALAGMLDYAPDDPRKDHLKPFELSSLPSGMRHRVKHGLEHIPRTEYLRWRQIDGTASGSARALREAGLPPEWANVYDKLWNAWFQAAEQLTPQSVQFAGLDRDVTEYVDRCWQRGPRRMSDGGLRYQSALKLLVLRQIDDDFATRSQVYSWIRSRHWKYLADMVDQEASLADLVAILEDRKDASKPGRQLDESDIRWLTNWVDEIYLISQARQSQNDLLVLPGSGDPISVSGRGRLAGVRPLADPPLPDVVVIGASDPVLLEQLSAMPPAVFSLARFRSRNAAQEFRDSTAGGHWWQRAISPRRRALFTISTTLNEVLAQPRPRFERGLLLLRIVATLVAAVLLTQDYHPLVEVGIALALTLLIVLPDMRQWWSGLRRRLERSLRVTHR